MMINTNFMPDIEVRYWFGWMIVFVFAGLYLLNFVCLIISLVYELKEALRRRAIKQHFAVEYSRKELMESNFFKSSRDQGPSSVQARLEQQSRSKAERDTAPRSKIERMRARRSFRRSHGSGFSES
jgi:hypothetical protein